MHRCLITCVHELRTGVLAGLFEQQQPPCRAGINLMAARACCQPTCITVVGCLAAVMCCAVLCCPARYRVSAFYLASAFSDLPMDCALPALFVVVIYFMGGLRLTAAAFFANLTALVSRSGARVGGWGLGGTARCVCGALW